MAGTRNRTWTPCTAKKPTDGMPFAVALAVVQWPAPNQYLNFVINAFANCSGYFVSVITKYSVRGDPVIDTTSD